MISQILFLIFAMFNSVFTIYCILRYAPIRDNPAKWGPEIRLGGFIASWFGFSFPRNADNLWAKALDCWVSLIFYEWVVLQAIGVSFTMKALVAFGRIRMVKTVGVRGGLLYFLISPGWERGYSTKGPSSRKGWKSLDDNSKSFSALIEKQISRFNGMISREGGRPLIGFFIRSLVWVGGRLSRSRCALTCIFTRLCYRIWRNEGLRGLTLYLKTSYVLIQQAIAGYQINDQTPLKRRVRVARSGLPYWIPRVQRDLLMRGDIKTIRFWTSLVSIYRVLTFEGKITVDSITDPGVDWIANMSEVDHSFFQEVVSIFWHKVGGSSLRKRWLDTTFEFFPIGKSSPLSSIIWTDRVLKGSISTAEDVIRASAFVLWNLYSEIVDSMQVFATDTKGFFEFFSSLRRSQIVDFVSRADYLSTDRFFIGKLGLKDEPAGKVRVFAMVDCWTQWLLRPLHLLLQDVLRQISEDATFDQIGAMDRKISQLSKRYRKPKAFSFDLSSATDRLPIGIQVSILQPLLGKYESKAWADILIGRPYALPARAKWATGLKSVKYAVGQPMGALSSWVMLAVTHHVVVQWAAARCGKLGWRRWFDEYVVLGDDIVIFDPHVAGHYWLIMTQILGVSIGLAKSIKARTRWVLEFAKKLWVDGEKAFVVPVRDILVSQLSTDTMVEFMNKHSATLNDYLRMRGLGFKSRSKWLGNLWSQPSRLRLYCVLWAYSNKEFMDWVTMRSLRDNFKVTREGIEKFITLLNDERRELVDRLEKRKTLSLEEAGALAMKPFYQGTSMLQELESVIQFGLLLNSKRIKCNLFFDLSQLDIYQLRIYLWEIKEDIEELEKAAESMSELTFLSSVRVEPRPFKDVVSIYKMWIRYNRCFLTTQDGRDPEALPEGIAPVVIPEPEPSIWVAPYWSPYDSKFSAWSPQRFYIYLTYVYRCGRWIRDRINYIMQFIWGGGIMWLLLCSVEQGGPFGSYPYSDPELTSSGSTDLPPVSVWEGLFFFILGGLSVFLIVFLFNVLGFYLVPEPDLSVISERFREMMEFERNAESVARELLEIPEVSIVTRSPQIGHGWSEPWSFNPDWPENWR